MSDLKTCTKCKVEKQKAEFKKKANQKSGLNPSCKDCESAYAREYYAANTDKEIARKSAYRKMNADVLASKGREYYAENSGKYTDNKREWRKANPDMSSANSRRRRANKIGAEGAHTAADVKAIFESQRGKCANCETKLFKSGAKKFHVDHIQPLAKGGSDWPSNLQCLCPTCNMRKGAKDPFDWAKEQGRLV